MRARHQILAKVGLLLVGLIGAVVPAEVTLRLRGYQSVFQQGPGIANPQLIELTDDPDLPYVLIPGARGRGWNTPVRLNRYGLRDREVSEDKGDRFRIAAFGDSITFGSEIPDPADLYPARLERLLRAGVPALHAEVLNFGVSGYDAVNNVEHLRVRGVRFRPDLIVLQVCLNDIGSASTVVESVWVARHLNSPIFRLRTAQFVVSRGLRILGLRRAERAEDLGAFMDDQRTRILPVGDDATLSRQMADLATLRTQHGLGRLSWWKDPPRLGFFEYALTRLRGLRQQHGFDVVVVGVPLLSHDNPRGRRLVNEIIRHETLKYGFRFVDVFDRFESQDPQRLRNDADDDIHPGPSGHAIIAQALYDDLVTSGLMRQR